MICCCHVSLYWYGLTDPYNLGVTPPPSVIHFSRCTISYAMEVVHLARIMILRKMTTTHLNCLQAPLIGLAKTIKLPVQGFGHQSIATTSSPTKEQDKKTRNTNHKCTYQQENNNIYDAWFNQRAGKDHRYYHTFFLQCLNCLSGLKNL